MKWWEQKSPKEFNTVHEGIKLRVHRLYSIIISLLLRRHCCHRCHAPVEEDVCLATRMTMPPPCTPASVGACHFVIAPVMSLSSHTSRCHPLPYLCHLQCCNHLHNCIGLPPPLLPPLKPLFIVLSPPPPCQHQGSIPSTLSLLSSTLLLWGHTPPSQIAKLPQVLPPSPSPMRSLSAYFVSLAPIAGWLLLLYPASRRAMARIAELPPSLP